MPLFSLRRSLLTLALLLACCFNVLAREPAPVSIPGTPDGTIKAVSAATAEGKLEVIWQALPASYQADIKKLLAEFAKKMDADLWAQGNKVAGKVTKLLTDKADFIVGNPMIAQQLQAQAVKPEDAKTYLSGVGGVLTEVQSSIATLQDVEKMNPEKLLANLGPKFREMNDLSAKLGFVAPGEDLADFLKVETKILESSTDMAKIEITKGDGSKETEKFVRVEGKWVPKEMADEWQTKIAAAMKELEKMKIAPEEKQQAIMFMGMANGFLDTFLNAKTQAEFDAAVNAVIPLISAGIPNQE